MKEVKLTEDEIELLRFLVKEKLKDFEEERDTILDNMSPGFMKSEEMNEDFMEKLKEKLK